MPRYIAIHPHTCTERDFRRLAERHDELPDDALWNRSWCGVREPVAFCDWEAVSGRAVADVFERFGVPYSSIHRVRYYRVEETGSPGVGRRGAREGNTTARRFVAVHLRSLEEVSLRALARRCREQSPRDVLWRCAWAGVDDAISFCDWEAPSAEAVAGVLGRSGMPCDALHEVRYHDRRLSVWHDPERPILAPAMA